MERNRRHVNESELNNLVRRNIETLIAVREKVERRKTHQEMVADAITRFAGSMPFVYIHALLFGGWILVNMGIVPAIRAFDPFPFVMLAMIASVEAIFLSTFVLISQNRMQALADKRADLDLQINLLAEHEVTRLICLVDDIARHLGITNGQDATLDELKKDVRPEEVIAEIERVARDRSDT
ncbi:DUF1003 domain-containing protein [Sorangium sp. So ce1000]|uniref:DUF1003 domain-containing protein n=1 Tax=Sorangium sp. So ce1000 TaxID=3133325 RepID=UPI003F627DF9